MRVYTYTDPVDLDRHIQEMQTILSNQINWLEHVFGLAYLETAEFNGENINYPRVYLGEGEHGNIMPNSDMSGTCFFYINEALDYSNEPIVEGFFNIIVAANLEKVIASDPTKYESVHSLISDFKSLRLDGSGGLNNQLKNTRRVQLQEVYFNDLSQVFIDFDFWSEAERRFRTYPMTCFRLNYSFTYSNDC